MRGILIVVILLLVGHDLAFGQNAPPMAGQALPPPAYAQPLGPPAVNPDPIGEPPWCESPYRNSAWRIELSLIPTVSDISDQAFGEWDDDGATAARLSLGYEDCDGYGMRLQFWGLDQEAFTFPTDVELTASTFYWDFYKRFFIEDAELVLGGGVAGGHLCYDLKTLNEEADFRGGGISVFGEAFYPFWRFEKTDIGSVVRARLGLLSGRWDDDGTPFINDTDHDVMTVMEIAWGMELRRRFGQNQDKYWYIDIVPEFQRWESSSLPDAFDPGFQGTNFSFGLAW